MHEINERSMPEDKINLDTFMSIKFVRNWFFAGFFAYISIFLVLGNGQYFHYVVKIFGALFLLFAYFVILVYKKWTGVGFHESIIRKKDLGLAVAYLSLVIFVLGAFVSSAITDFIKFIFSAFKG